MKLFTTTWNSTGRRHRAEAMDKVRTELGKTISLIRSRKQAYRRWMKIDPGMSPVVRTRQLKNSDEHRSENYVL